jgi:uncharacterized protein
VRDEELIASLDNGSLHLLLMPTEACNFRCTYCYEDFRHGRMLPAVVQGVKALLARRAPGLHRLGLSWFGGEPLLARDVLEEIQTHALALAHQHPGMRVAADITTNAYTLTRPCFERLLHLGIEEYQISLDGWRKVHDRKRVRINGGGTFDRIWGNLLHMRPVQQDFGVTVRLHVDRENHAEVPEFLDAFRAAFGTDGRFKLFLRLLSRWGGPNDAQLRVFAGSDARDTLDSLRELAKNRGVPIYAPETESSVCYAARGNSFVIRADGRVNKCTLALEHPRNQVGRILPDGRLKLHSPRMHQWMRGLVSQDPQELQCPMLGYAEVASKQASALAASVPAAVLATV